ncbi:MAG: DUF4386 family protein [Terrimonas sp.]|nr:DUF4386 family protein [Terrimonas sp.]
MELSLRKSAIIAGTGYILIFVLGLITNFSVFEKLIITGDAATTTNNIMEQTTVFRLGLVSWLVVLICDTIIAWALFYLFKPVSRSGSLLVALFRIVYIVVFGAALTNLVSVLHIIGHPVGNTAYMQGQVMLFMDAYTYGFHFGIIFFGVHLFLMGYLMFRSGFMSKWVGILLIIAGVGYLVDSFSNILSPAYTANKTASLFVVAIPAIIAELAFTIWLLMKAGKNKV